MGTWFLNLRETLIRCNMTPLVSLLTCLLVVGSSGRQAQAAERQPNIVWLVQDHVPWRQYASTDGPKPTLATFERLAAEGIVFEQARTVLPLCAPARASMMTGVLPHNHGVTTNDEVRVRNTFYPYYQPFNQYLQANDYVAAYFGKWHAGVVDAMQLGFEGYAPKAYGNPYETAEYKAYLAERGLPYPIILREWHVAQQPRFGVGSIQTEPANNGGMAGRLLTPVETHESHFVAALATEWLDDYVASGKEEPFVLRVDTWGPHQPYFVAEPFVNTVDPSTIPEYPNFANTFADRPVYQQNRRDFHRNRSGMLRWEDWQPVLARVYENFAQNDAAFLQVLDALERNGLMENTIIIYTADHGDIIGSGGGLFDKDAFMTEEVMAIPLVVRWPGVTDGGKRSDAYVSNMDVVPTVLEMAGVSVPEVMDGISLVPLIQDPAQAPKRETFFAEHHGHNNMSVPQRALYYGDYKLVAHLDDKHEFYDLATDPYEMRNLIDDPDMQTVIYAVKTRLFQEMVASGDNSADAKRLMEQLGLDYAEVTYGQTTLRLTPAKDIYHLEAPYGTETLLPLTVQPVTNNGATGAERTLTFRMTTTDSVSGLIMIESYDAQGVLFHTAQIQLSVATQPKVEMLWGQRPIAQENLAAQTINGTQTFTVKTDTVDELWSKVEAQLLPVIEGEPVEAKAITLYSGVKPPQQFLIDSSQYSDGAYNLRVALTAVSGDRFQFVQRVVVSNWVLLTDELEPPQNSGWFGVVVRRNTIAESSGWSSVSGQGADAFSDASRLVATGPARQYLVWKMSNLKWFTLTLYTRDLSTVTQDIQVAASVDQSNWQTLSTQVSEAVSLANGWYQVKLKGMVNGTLSAQYLRVLIDTDTAQATDYQLGYIEIAAPK